MYQATFTWDMRKYPDKPKETKGEFAAPWLHTPRTAGDTFTA